MPSQRFDVFMCHNSKDKLLVLRAAQLLKQKYRLRPWLDTWRIPAGDMGDLEMAASQSDIITCTPSKQPFLRHEFVSPGTFVAAAGADSTEEQKVDTALMAQAKIVADLIEQCAAIGELHHALEEGIVTTENMHAELGEVVAGVKAGRTSPEEIIVFDSTGAAVI